MPAGLGPPGGDDGVPDEPHGFFLGPANALRAPQPRAKGAEPVRCLREWLNLDEEPLLKAGRCPPGYVIERRAGIGSVLLHEPSSIIVCPTAIILSSDGVARSSDGYFFHYTSERTFRKLVTDDDALEFACELHKPLIASVGTPADFADARVVLQNFLGPCDFDVLSGKCPLGCRTADECFHWEGENRAGFCSFCLAFRLPGCWRVECVMQAALEGRDVWRICNPKDPDAQPNATVRQAVRPLKNHRKSSNKEPSGPDAVSKKHHSQKSAGYPNNDVAASRGKTVGTREPGKKTGVHVEKAQEKEESEDEVEFLLQAQLQALDEEQAGLRFRDPERQRRPRRRKQ